MFPTTDISSKAKLSLVCCTLFFLLGGCGDVTIFGFGSNEEAELKAPSRDLIVKGMDEYNVGKYYLAVKYFEEILNRYPFSPEAPLAELKAADAYYYMKQYAEAILLYEEFEDKHPTNEAIPYVMYQKAMCYYKQIDRVDRDTTGASNAINYFSQLLRAFPDTPYTEEAKRRIQAAEDFLVSHEFFVVKFYLRTEKYSQAEARLKYLLSMYPDASMAPKAKMLLEQIESGNPPKTGLSSYFSDFTLPDWNFFAKEGVEEVQVK